MAKYTVVVTRTVQKQLAKLPDSIADRLEEKMLLLENEPRPHGCTKLKQRDAYRIRSGDYRIIYEIKDETLLVKVIKIGHRREVYRR